MLGKASQTRESRPTQELISLVLGSNCRFRPWLLNLSGSGFYCPFDFPEQSCIGMHDQIFEIVQKPRHITPCISALYALKSV